MAEEEGEDSVVEVVEEEAALEDVGDLTMHLIKSVFLLAPTLILLLIFRISFLNNSE